MPGGYEATQLGRDFRRMVEKLDMRIECEMRRHEKVLQCGIFEGYS